MVSSMFNEIRSWFSKCPLIDGIVGVDQLDESKKVIFSITPFLAGDRAIKKYIDGKEVRQLPFYLQSTKTWTIDYLDTNENLEFFMNLSEWIEEKNKRHELPNINGILSIDVLSDGYLADNGGKFAVYQIQCRATYLH